VGHLALNHGLERPGPLARRAGRAVRARRAGSDDPQSGDGVLLTESTIITEYLDEQGEGRPLFGVEMRVQDDSGAEIAHDGVAFAELQVRGPWVASAYFNRPGDPAFQSDDGGATWSFSYSYTSTLPVTPPGPFNTFPLIVDPVNPNRIVFGGVVLLTAWTGLVNWAA
jgi:acyl-CoA synthetase (AMP-forming)/AMP-acid ligase II